MTRGAFTIGANQTLSIAHELMREHHVRHLPVLERGAIVGLVSQRDLYFIETLQGVDAGGVPVSEAMSPEPYLVTADTPVVDVARQMAERKLGCAIVTESDDVIGMFTTVDALRLLARVLDAEAAPVRRAAPTRAKAPRTKRPAPGRARPRAKAAAARRQRKPGA